MSIDRTGDGKIGIGVLEGVVDRLGRNRRPVRARNFVNSLDLLRCNERTRGVMHSNIARAFIQSFQASTYGILSAFAACNDRSNFLKIFAAQNLFDVILSIWDRDLDDFGDGIGPLKSVDGMRKH